MECHASKNSLRYHWEQRSTISTSSKLKSWLVCAQCCAKRDNSSCHLLAQQVTRTPCWRNVDGHVTITLLPKSFGLIGYQISLAMELRWRASALAPLKTTWQLSDFFLLSVERTFQLWEYICLAVPLWHIFCLQVWLFLCFQRTLRCTNTPFSREKCGSLWLFTTWQYQLAVLSSFLMRKSQINIVFCKRVLHRTWRVWLPIR